MLFSQKLRKQQIEHFIISALMTNQPSHIISTKNISYLIG